MAIDFADPKCLQAFGPPSYWSGFTDQGQLLVLGDFPELRKFSLTGQVEILPIPEPSATHAALHPSQPWIAIAGRGPRALVVDLRDGRLICSGQRHSGSVSQVTFVDSGRVLVSAGVDGKVKFSSCPAGRQVRTQMSFKGSVHSLAANEGGLLAVCHQRGVCAFDHEIKFEKDYYYGHGGQGASDVWVSPDGEIWLALRTSPELRRLSPASGEIEASLQLGKAAFNLAQHGQRLAVGLMDEIVVLEDWTVYRRWSAPNGSSQHRSPVSGLSFSPDSAYLCSLDVAGGVWLWTL